MAESRNPEVVDLEPRTAALLREVVRMDALPAYFERAFNTVARVVTAQKRTLAGPPLAMYFGMPSETVDVGAGFPVDGPLSPDAGVTTVPLPGGPAAQVLHVGSYDAMSATYQRLMAWVAEQGLRPGPIMWESYLTQPDPAAPEATQTLIVWPLAP